MKFSRVSRWYGSRLPTVNGYILSPFSGHNLVKYERRLFMFKKREKRGVMYRHVQSNLTTC